jgi:hypothetical protein
MACFIKEQNVIEGQNPVKVYITRRGKTVSNYQSNVPIRHSVFNSLSPALQLSILRRKANRDMRKGVADFVQQRQARQEAREARQKKREDQEQKHETVDEASEIAIRKGIADFVQQRQDREKARKARKNKPNRFGRLANIDNFGMADFLTEPESKAVSGISPEMTEKVKKLPQLLPTLPEDPKLRQKIVSEMIAYDYDRSGSLYYADNIIAHIQRLITPRSPLNTYYYKVIDYINKIKRDRPFSSITGSQWNRITQWNRIGREL